jgi:hypothetical protein
MAGFSFTNSTAWAGTAQVNVSATYASQLVVAASSGGMVSPGITTGLKRGKITDWAIGTPATPADNFIEFEIARVTAGSTLVWLGTISSVSSGMMLDPADVGIASFAMNNSSAETNLAVSQGQPWYFAMNQRASYRYIVVPGQEIVWPATSSTTGNNGLALKARATAFANTVSATIWGIEL